MDSNESVNVAISEMSFTIGEELYVFERPLSVNACGNINSNDPIVFQSTVYLDLMAPKSSGEVLVDFIVDWDTTYMPNAQNLYARIQLDDQVEPIFLEPDQGEQTHYFSLPIDLSNTNKGHNLNIIISYG